MTKKRVAFIISMVVAAGCIGFGAYSMHKKSASDSSATIDDYGEDNGETNLICSGIIEPEQTYNINLDSERTVDSIEIKVGDHVTAGQTLFTYQSKDYSLQIKQANLEIENLNDSINSYKSQIEDLKKEKANASAEMALSYDSQIQDLNQQMKQANLEIQTKKAEVDSLNKKVNSSKVISPIDGIVSSVNANAQGSGPFITLLSSGTFRVKTNIDEMNVGNVKEGMTVTIKTRTGKKKYTGKISKVETNNPSSENNSPDETADNQNTPQGASKYYFYVSIDNPEGLIVGQHVYVEPDLNSAPEAEGEE